MRTFDPWTGHSHAGGFSSGGGNNQESTSEAMQGWAGAFLMGLVTNDKAMTDSAIFGYLSESRAIAEYWFDRDAENLPDNYKHTMVGILFDGRPAFATFFSGDPGWIHGIQWLPPGPYLDYLFEDPEYAQKDFDQLMRETKNKEIAEWGSGLGNVVLSYLAGVDPLRADQLFQKYQQQNLPIITDVYTSGLTNYHLQMRKLLGKRNYAYVCSIPAAAVYQKDETLHYVLYNPEDRETSVKVTHAGRLHATIRVPARSCVTHTGKTSLTGLRLELPQTVVEPGNSLQVKGGGVDAYGATTPATTSWHAGRGTVTPDGIYQAPEKPGPDWIEIRSGALRKRVDLLVGAAPQASRIMISPAEPRLVQGASLQLHASVVDQYDRPFAGPVEWAVQGGELLGNTFVAQQRPGLASVRIRAGKLSQEFPIQVLPPPQKLPVSVTSVSSTNGNNVGKNMVDGKQKTRWESQFRDGEEVVFGLTGSPVLSQFRITWEPAFAKELRIDALHRGTVTGTFHEKKGTGGVQTIDIAATCDQLKLQLVKRATQYGFSIFEVDALGYATLPHLKPYADAKWQPSKAHKAARLTANLLSRFTQGLPPLAPEKTRKAVIYPETTVLEAGEHVRLGLVDGGSWVSAAKVEWLSPKGAPVFTAGGKTKEVSLRYRGETYRKTYAIVPANLARRTRVTASSTNGNNAPEKSIDGKASSRWESEFKDQQWIRYSFDAPQLVAQIEIDWETARAADYVVYGVDGDGKQIPLVKAANTKGLNHVHNFPPVKVHAIHLACQKRATQYGFSIFETRIHGPPPN
jgi:hypothetical protein